MYESFCVRIHDDSRVNLADSASWTLKTGAGDLVAYKVDTVKDESPAPKTDYVDIPGANGVYDLTEASGRVTFENKTVTVKLSGATTESAMKTLWSGTLSRIHGHVCDFTFDPASNVTMIRTGRVSVVMDYKNHQITFTFDAEPFGTKTAPTTVTIPLTTNANSSGAFSRVEAIGGSETYNGNSESKFYMGVSDVGTVLRYQRSGLTAGDIYTLGVTDIVGGDIAFYNNGTLNKVKGVVDSSGKLELRITIDGSYFEWHTVLIDGEYVLKCYPSFICNFILAKITASSALVTIPSNTRIYPDISNLAYLCTIIMDGNVLVVTNATEGIKNCPNAFVPGIRADKTGATSESVFVCIPNQAQSSPITITMHMKEVI